MWLVAVNIVSANLPLRLASGVFVVGRSKHADIVIADFTVSRRHARLRFSGSTLHLEDLDSSNGTFVNDVAISHCQLNLGDRLRFGSAKCEISLAPFADSRNEEENTSEIPVPKSSSDTTITAIFTGSQQKIIPLLMDGKSETEIAALLNKSRHTIHAHIRAIFDRMSVHSREELIVKLMTPERISQEKSTD
jgi:DNA-binding CsgD family transcriptional regulator